MIWKPHASGMMPRKRATVSRHTGAAQGEHLDIFLEQAENASLLGLRTDVASLTALEAGKPFPCEPSFAHRRRYLEYSGELSNGRGEVSVLWQGFHTLGEAVDTNLPLILQRRGDTLHLYANA